METISLADAKAHLSEIVDRAEAGGTVTITRRGKQVALLVSAERPRTAVNLAALRKLTAEMPPQTDAATLVRAMRDDDRY